MRNWLNEFNMGGICTVSEQKLIRITQKTVMFELFLTFSNFYKRMFKEKKILIQPKQIFFNV